MAEHQGWGDLFTPPGQTCLDRGTPAGPLVQIFSVNNFPNGSPVSYSSQGHKWSNLTQSDCTVAAVKGDILWFYRYWICPFCSHSSQSSFYQNGQQCIGLKHSTNHRHLSGVDGAKVGMQPLATKCIESMHTEMLTLNMLLILLIAPKLKEWQKSPLYVWKLRSSYDHVLCVGIKPCILTERGSLKSHCPRALGLIFFSVSYPELSTSVLKGPLNVSCQHRIY